MVMMMTRMTDDDNRYVGGDADDLMMMMTASHICAVTNTVPEDSTRLCVFLTEMGSR